MKSNDRKEKKSLSSEQPRACRPERRRVLPNRSPCNLLGSTGSGGTAIAGWCPALFKRCPPYSNHRSVSGGLANRGPPRNHQLAAAAAELKPFPTTMRSRFGDDNRDLQPALMRGGLAPPGFPALLSRGTGRFVEGSPLLQRQTRGMKTFGAINFR